MSLRTGEITNNATEEISYIGLTYWDLYIGLTIPTAFTSVQNRNARYIAWMLDIL